MGLSKVWIIPLCTFIFSLAAFVVSYSIAVSLGHVSAFWPYISDSGAFSPESCVFGQLLNLSALFLAISVYLRHRQIVEFYWHQYRQVGKWRGVSCGLLWLGYTSAFGVSLVANFQESNVIYVHYFGALLSFGSGLIYTWAQTLFSYLISPKFTKPVVSHFRLCLCILSTFFFATMIIFGVVLGRHPDTDKPTNRTDTYKWTGHEPNYAEHMIGTCSEWLLAICFQIYILSFAVELRHAYCHAPKLKLLAFLSTSESAVSTGIFDCCVVPSAINVRNNSNTLDVCVTGYSLDKTTGSQEKVNTLSTTTSSNDYISSNSSLNSSPAQDEKDKF